MIESKKFRSYSLKTFFLQGLFENEIFRSSWFPTLSCFSSISRCFLGERQELKKKKKIELKCNFVGSQFPFHKQSVKMCFLKNFTSSTNEARRFYEISIGRFTRMVPSMRVAGGVRSTTRGYKKIGQF